MHDNKYNIIADYANNYRISVSTRHNSELTTLAPPRCRSLNSRENLVKWRENGLVGTYCINTIVYAIGI